MGKPQKDAIKFKTKQNDNEKSSKSSIIGSTSNSCQYYNSNNNDLCPPLIPPQSYWKVENFSMHDINRFPKLSFVICRMTQNIPTF